MSVSIKNLLIKKFEELKNELININIDPALLPIDVTDTSDFGYIIGLIEYLFPTNDNIEKDLGSLLNFKNIVLTNDQFEKLVEIVTKYLVFLQKVKKYV